MLVVPLEQANILHHTLNRFLQTCTLFLEHFDDSRLLSHLVEECASLVVGTQQVNIFVVQNAEPI